MRRVIAVDPGVTCTGVVIMDAEDDGTFKMYGAATFTASRAKDKKRSPHERAADLVEAVGVWIDGVYEQNDLEWHDVEIVLAIERPIYNNNAKSFELQWRVFQQFVSRFSDGGFMDRVSEVHNGTAKAALTGDGSASKEKMLKHTPFAVHQFPLQDHREAVTDAYAIGLAYEKGNPVFPAEWEEKAASPEPMSEWGPH